LKAKAEAEQDSQESNKEGENAVEEDKKTP
jgi:hypothetical protein